MEENKFDLVDGATITVTRKYIELQEENSKSFFLTKDIISVMYINKDEKTNLGMVQIELSETRLKLPSVAALKLYNLVKYILIGAGDYED